MYWGWVPWNICNQGVQFYFKDQYLYAKIKSDRGDIVPLRATSFEFKKSREAAVC